MDKKLKGITTNITAYKKLNLDKDEKDAIAKLEANLPEYNKVCTKIREMSSTGNVKLKIYMHYFSSNQQTFRWIFEVVQMLC